jgi:hypothetical protein
MNSYHDLVTRTFITHKKRLLEFFAELMNDAR